MTRDLFARDVMRKNVVSLTPSATLQEARDIFLQHKINGVPVVSEDNTLLGVISQTDLVRVLVSRGIDEMVDDSSYVGMVGWGAHGSEAQGVVGDRIKSLCVSDLMSANVFTASPDDSVSLLARNMRLHNIHRIVITERGKVVGLVTSMDMLRIIEGDGEY
ncbi:MAG: CBS domain-containing protein [Deltaproteobacteria bacterium]|nr:CBS domain-containing protein [Deltaproteobacteria bacterium]